ncbi:MAG: hypothetical protein HQL69_19015 [Magnetococcales bacterium]|nr:hypothetical protein [Magnetococcales bacterium]
MGNIGLAAQLSQLDAERLILSEYSQFKPNLDKKNIFIIRGAGGLSPCWVWATPKVLLLFLSLYI